MSRFLPAGVTACGGLLLTASMWGPPTRVIGATITVIGVILVALAHVSRRLDRVEQARVREATEHDDLQRERDVLESQLRSARAELQAERIIRGVRERGQARHAQQSRRPGLRLIKGGMVAMPAAIGGWLLARARENALGTATVAGLIAVTPATAPLFADMISPSPEVVTPPAAPTPVGETDVSQPGPVSRSTPAPAPTVTVTASPEPTAQAGEQDQELGQASGEQATPAPAVTSTPTVAVTAPPHAPTVPTAEPAQPTGAEKPADSELVDPDSEASPDPGKSAESGPPGGDDPPPGRLEDHDEVDPAEIDYSTLEHELAGPYTEHLEALLVFPEGGLTLDWLDFPDWSRADW